MAEAAEALLFVNVCDWLILQDEGEDYVGYTIRTVSTDRSFPKYTFLARRRSSEFEELRQLLVSRHGEIVPAIPPINGDPSDVFNPQIIKERIKSYTSFLHSILAIPVLKLDPSVQLFLQTIDTMERIREIFQPVPQQQPAANGEHQDNAADGRKSSNAERDENAASNEEFELIFPIDDV